MGGLDHERRLAFPLVAVPPAAVVPAGAAVVRVVDHVDALGAALDEETALDIADSVDAGALALGGLGAGRAKVAARIHGVVRLALAVAVVGPLRAPHETGAIHAGTDPTKGGWWADHAVDAAGLRGGVRFTPIAAGVEPAQADIVAPIVEAQT